MGHVFYKLVKQELIHHSTVKVVITIKILIYSSFNQIRSDLNFPAEHLLKEGESAGTQ